MTMPGIACSTTSSSGTADGAGRSLAGSRGADGSAAGAAAGASAAGAGTDGSSVMSVASVPGVAGAAVGRGAGVAVAAAGDPFLVPADGIAGLARLREIMYAPMRTPTRPIPIL